MTVSSDRIPNKANRPTLAEYAQRVVDGHVQGLYCSAEVLIQILHIATPSTLVEFLSRLTPELNSYMKGHVNLTFYDDACTGDQLVLLQLIRKWYEMPAVDSADTFDGS